MNCPEKEDVDLRGFYLHTHFPTESAEKAARQYQEISKAGAYASRISGTGTDLREKNCILEALKIAQIPAGSSVLDCPCGPGRLFPILKKAGFRITAPIFPQVCLSMCAFTRGHGAKNVSMKQTSFVRWICSIPVSRPAGSMRSYVIASFSISLGRRNDYLCSRSCAEYRQVPLLYRIFVTGPLTPWVQYPERLSSYEKPKMQTHKPVNICRGNPGGRLRYKMLACYTPAYFKTLVRRPRTHFEAPHQPFKFNFSL